MAKQKRKSASLSTKLWSKEMVALRRYGWCVCAAMMTLSSTALSGPPFKTDDPEPVELGHWEAYVASQQQFALSETDATLPHFEFNYGILPDVQAHIVAPMGYQRTEDGARYGFSSTELGVKYRFMEESDELPQVGVFPLAELPTGDRRLEGTEYQLYFPVWLQKSWGHLTTYGGAGYWINPGTGNRNWTFAGWQVQYDFSDVLTLGGELTYNSTQVTGAHSDGGCDLGGYVNLDEHNHFLFSLGHNFLGAGTTFGYLGYQITG